MYCDCADIARQLKEFTFTANSIITTDDIQAYCELISAEIGSVMVGAGVKLELIDQRKLTFLKSVAISGVKWQVYSAINKEEEQINNLQDIYQTWLTFIAEHPDSLQAASVGAVSISVSGTEISDPITVEGDNW